MAEKEEGQSKSPHPLRRTLLDLASNPRIPQGAYLVAISVAVGLATALSCVLFLSVLKWITWHLPVVDPDNPKKLVGIISRLHVIRAYNRALTNKHLL